MSSYVLRKKKHENYKFLFKVSNLRILLVVRRADDSPAEISDGNSDIAEGGDANDDDDYEEEYDITDYDEDAMYEEYESR